MKTKPIITTALVTVLILLVPFIGTWPWTAFDFALAGGLIFGTLFVYQLLGGKISDRRRRVMLGIVLAVLFLLVWAELAVGIFH